MSKLSITEVEDAYERYMESIYAFFAAKLLDKKAAEDLTSETFMTFVKHARNDEDIENIRAYLYGIAKNLFLQHLKKKYAEPHVSYVEFDDFAGYVDSTVETTRTKSLEERILPFLEYLPEKQCEVIKLRLIDKYSLSEIATKLNKDMNYVKTTQKRAIKKLRELIACTPETTTIPSVCKIAHFLLLLVNIWMWNLVLRQFRLMIFF